MPVILQLRHAPLEARVDLEKKEIPGAVVVDKLDSAADW